MLTSCGVSIMGETMKKEELKKRLSDWIDSNWIVGSIEVNIRINGYSEDGKYTEESSVLNLNRQAE